MRPSPRTRPSRGFSLPELAVTLVVLATLIAVGVPTFQRVLDGSGGHSDPMFLNAAHVELLREGTLNGGTFPSALNEQIRVAGAEITSGPSTDAAVLSLAVSGDARTAAVAAVAGGRCLGVVVTAAGSDQWGFDPDTPAGCLAADVLDTWETSPFAGTYEAPTEIALN